ncbi:Beta carbonic anhydrase 1 [Aphelenchoides bicaudatus]|nr:Beta carbonic anhydrase 1 [Aphelenchoides bicaudatus]
MEKVIRGALSFRHNKRAHLIKEFKKIRDNPKPSILMFTCMDSRMLPTRITQANVGEIFVVRNAGNLIPSVQNYGPTGSDVSINTEPAALELAVKRGGINHIVVCGHSDCKAMNTLYGLHTKPETFNPSSPFDNWLRTQGNKSINRLKEAVESAGKSPLQFRSRVHSQFCFDAFIDPLNKLAVEDKLSQVNVLQQVLNIGSHAIIRPFIDNLFVHALWFDIYDGEFYLFSRRKQMFVRINEISVPVLLEELDQFESQSNN